MNVRSFSAILAALWILNANAAEVVPSALAPPSVKIFKGEWTGPLVRKMPGKGPARGQGIDDYFANLKTGQRSPSPKRVLVLGGARIKQYGKGRVFGATLGHAREAYDDPEIIRMYREAIKWVLGLNDGPYPALHPKR